MQGFRGQSVLGIWWRIKWWCFWCGVSQEEEGGTEGWGTPQRCTCWTLHTRLWGSEQRRDMNWPKNERKKNKQKVGCRCRETVQELHDGPGEWWGQLESEQWWQDWWDVIRLWIYREGRSSTSLLLDYIQSLKGREEVRMTIGVLFFWTTGKNKVAIFWCFCISIKILESISTKKTVGIPIAVALNFYI